MNEQAAPNRGRKKGNFSRAAAFHGYWGKDWVEKGRGNKEPKWETRGRANIKNQNENGRKRTFVHADAQSRVTNRTGLERELGR